MADDAQRVLDPQIPPDYDIYAGIFCSRLGTPTSRTRSGSLQEFEDAVERRKNTGSPEVFVYFCRPSGPPTTEQEAGVQGFRAEFPGLFYEFSDLADLAHRFKHHVLLWLFRESSPLGPSAPATAGRNRLLPAKDGNETLDRLERLFSLAVVLSPSECRALTDAIALSAGTVATAEVLCVRRRASDWPTSPTTRCNHQNRCELLAALVRVAARLAGVRAADPGRVDVPPDADAPAGAWVAHLTLDIRVLGPGVAQFVLDVPDASWIDPLRQNTSLALEAEWYRCRRVLTLAGLSLAVAPAEMVLRRHNAPPLQVRDRLAVEAAGVRQELEGLLKDFDHYGPAHAPDLWRLLPLPRSAVSGVMRFNSSVGHEAVLEIVASGDPETRLEYRSDQGSIEVDASRLKPGCEWTWHLTVDYGIPEVVARGAFRTLSPTAASIWEAASTLGREQRSLIAGQLDLGNERLQMCWPLLADGKASMEDRLAVVTILAGAIDDINERHPSSTRLEAFRQAMDWVRAGLFDAPEGGRS